MWYRVVLFYVLTFFLTMVLGGLQEATGAGVGLITLPQLAPGLAGLLMLAIFRKGRLRLSFSLNRRQAARLLPAALLPVSAGLVLVLLLHVSGIQPLSAVSFSVTLLGAPGMLAGAFGEELGWRGYLHKSVDRKLRPALSSLLVGVLWALWHVGLYQNGAVYMLFAVILITSYAFVAYALVRDIDFNVWVATLFHFAINMSNLMYLQVMTDTRLMAINALVWAALAAIVWGRKGLLKRG